jgi:hypothetical protein
VVVESGKMSETNQYIQSIAEALEEIESLSESSLSRLYSQNKDKNFGTITAWRKDPKNKNQHSDNIENNRKLRSMIHSAGYGTVSLHGRYAESDGAGNEHHVKEHSFGVIGKHGDDGGELLKHMKGWGKAFGQDTILHKSHDSDDAYLHATNDKSWVKDEPEGKFKVGKFTPNVTNPNGDSSLKGHSFSYLNDNKPGSEDYRPQEKEKLGKKYV